MADFIPRNKGGRGMIQLELSYKTSTIGQHKHLTTITDWMLQLVLAHDKTNSQNRRTNQTKLGKQTSALKVSTAKSKHTDVDKGNTHQWLCSADQKAETEGFVMAAQEAQSAFTRNYQAKIIKNHADPKCWFCEKF